MVIASGLFQIEGVPDSSQAVPGMAYFAGSGPEGKTCGDCIHRGYSRLRKTTGWNERLQREVVKSYRHHGCAMFKQLAGHHGPTVATDNHACKYFAVKP